MKKRCSVSTDPEYPRYGGRGISVCKEWRDSFLAFLRDMGEKPKGLSLDRIDNNGNYEPSNCRWATLFQQNRNRRDNRFLTHEGRTQCLGDWAKELGMDQGLLWHHVVRRGKSIGEIINGP